MFTDYAISKDIFNQGCFECDVMKAAMQVLERNPDASLLDIGANIGQYSLQAAAMNHKAYAFEPFAENYKRFCHSVKSNGFLDRIHIFKTAVMKESRKVKLQGNEQNKGASYVSRYSQKEEKSTTEGEGTVFAHGVTLDAMREFLPRGPVVLKVDVEGGE